MSIVLRWDATWRLDVAAPKGWACGPVRPRLRATFAAALARRGLDAPAFPDELSFFAADDAADEMARDATLTSVAGREWVVRHGLARVDRGPPHRALDGRAVRCGDDALEACRATNGHVRAALQLLEAQGDVDAARHAFLLASADCGPDGKTVAKAAKSAAARCGAALALVNQAALLGDGDGARRAALCGDALDLLPSCTTLIVLRVHALVQLRWWRTAHRELDVGPALIEAILARAALIAPGAADVSQAAGLLKAALQCCAALAGRPPPDASAAGGPDAALAAARCSVAAGDFERAGLSFAAAADLDAGDACAVVWRARCDVALAATCRTLDACARAAHGLDRARRDLDALARRRRGAADAADAMSADAATVDAAITAVEARRDRLWAAQKQRDRAARWGEDCDDATQLRASIRLARFLKGRRRPTDETTLYDVLGVARGASPEEIRLAHRKRMLETHPDKNLGDESAPRRFLGVQAAFRVLSDADRRALYDRKLDLG